MVQVHIQRFCACCLTDVAIALWEVMYIPYALQRPYGALAWHTREDGRQAAQCRKFRS